MAARAAEFPGREPQPIGHHTRWWSERSRRTRARRRREKKKGKAGRGFRGFSRWFPTNAPDGERESGGGGSRSFWGLRRRRRVERRAETKPTCDKNLAAHEKPIHVVGLDLEGRVVETRVWLWDACVVPISKATDKSIILLPPSMI